ncbi:hypothetical protein [Paenibacillus puerhi]|uniref:hypothetical protein n=1 Tax=Paenibacillus puerhi TaxID=2692622 RepID=UPI001F280E24|nr:hypothetical protein [Paenibacillus puerhi]
MTMPAPPSLTYALDMALPGGKRPGYYAQIIKALAERATVFDRDKELFIFLSASDRESALPVMSQYNVPAEPIDLLLLPESFTPRPTFTDFGFVSRMERFYLYADTAVLFRLFPASPSSQGSFSNPVSAALQLEEHLLGHWVGAEGQTAYAMESQHDELAVGIARAYGCSLEWLYKPL